jgi:hypothetical protein
MSKLKNVSLATGAGTPKPISAYTTDHGSAKNNGAGGGTVPRDGGLMSDGTTGGNFAINSMTARPNNPGQHATEEGAAAANAAFTGNKQ